MDVVWGKDPLSGSKGRYSYQVILRGGGYVGCSRCARKRSWGETMREVREEGENAFKIDRLGSREAFSSVGRQKGGLVVWKTQGPHRT